MKKLAGLLLLVAALGLPTTAQDSQAPQPEQSPASPSDQNPPAKVKRVWPTPKAEISGGFVYRSFYALNGATIGMKGGYGSYQYNLYRWLGVTGEVLGVFGTEKSNNLPPQSLHVFTALAGPQIYPLGRHRLDPFAHFMFGAGILTDSVPEFSGFPSNDSTTAVKAWQVGGGLDWNVKPHWAVRVIQVDYQSAKFFGNGVPNQGAKRISFGFVYHFGEK
jgi:opacity protein-like surface antigen